MKPLLAVALPFLLSSCAPSAETHTRWYWGVGGVVLAAIVGGALCHFGEELDRRKCRESAEASDEQ